MHDPINQYGDKRIMTSGQHGVDIAAQRLDELDTLAIRFLLDWTDGARVACDIGCGSGVQGMRFSLCGAETHLYDIVDWGNQVQQMIAALPDVALTFHSGNVVDTFPASGLHAVTLVYSQRTLHYLRFSDAVQLLQDIKRVLVPGGRVFLSVSGIASELGNGYEVANLPLVQRFAHLAPTMREKHAIYEPICLYSEDDVHTLAERSGYRDVRVWSSAFGNVKAVFG